MEEKAKRKTRTSSEVKVRYNRKTYQTYTLSFRKVEDADIIAQIEALRAAGKSITDIFRDIIRSVE